MHVTLLSLVGSIALFVYPFATCDVTRGRSQRYVCSSVILNAWPSCSISINLQASFMNRIGQIAWGSICSGFLKWTPMCANILFLKIYTCPYHLMWFAINVNLCNTPFYHGIALGIHQTSFIQFLKVIRRIKLDNCSLWYNIHPKLKNKEAESSD